MRGGVACERVSEDGMRSDGEGSDRAEEEAPSPQVRLPLFTAQLYSPAHW